MMSVAACMQGSMQGSMQLGVKGSHTPRSRCLQDEAATRGPIISFSSGMKRDSCKYLQFHTQRNRKRVTRPKTAVLHVVGVAKFQGFDCRNGSAGSRGRREARREFEGLQLSNPKSRAAANNSPALCSFAGSFERTTEKRQPDPTVWKGRILCTKCSHWVLEMVTLLDMVALKQSLAEREGSTTASASLAVADLSSRKFDVPVRSGISPECWCILLKVPQPSHTEVLAQMGMLQWV